jgi:hypothetical protein
MGDLVVLVLVVVLFVAFVGLVALCDRIVGTTDVSGAEAERVEADHVVR